MADFWSFGVYFWLLLSLLMNVSALDGGREDGLLTELSRNVEMPSECVLSCTAQTYRQMLEKRDMLTVRFNPTSSNELGVHCWPTQMKHGLGEHLQQAYIMLPLHEAMQGVKDILTLRPTFPFQQDNLRPHSGQTPLSNDCGLRFDVTSPFITSENQPMFCVEIVPPLSTLGRALKCPPFMVTTWSKQRLSPT